MPKALNRLAGPALVFVAIVALCGPFRAAPPDRDEAVPPPPAPPFPPAPSASSGTKPTRLQPTRAELNQLPAGDLDDAELAGLPRDSRPAILTWECAYALALIRGRGGRPARGDGLAESLDLNALDEAAKKYAVGDFARFRGEFFSGRTEGEGDGGFHDPSAGLLDLQCRLQAIENARRNVAVFEGLMQVFRYMIEGEPSGLSQIQLDELDSALQQARLRLLDEIGHYRDRLDTLKVRLGLSPHAPVVIDRGNLAAFADVFDKVHRWIVDPNREMTDLPRIVEQLPLLEDVVIDGRSTADVVDMAASRSSTPGEDGVRQIALEELLSAGARAAARDRGEAGAEEDVDARRELRVRRAIRQLLLLRRAYELGRRRFIFVIRKKDRALEQLTAPPPFLSREEARRLVNNPRATRLGLNTEFLKELATAEEQYLASQDRLVSLWTSYQTLRLALHRDLGTLPVDDWKAFSDEFRARPGKANRQGVR